MSHIVDNIDRNILRSVQKDATLNMDELAEQVGLSRNAAWRRLRSLEEAGIIKARVALLDPSKLDLGLSVICMIRHAQHEKNWLKRFHAVVTSFPEIQSAHRMSGDLDYVLRVRVADVAGYDAFYKKLIDAIPISDISASFVMEDIKETTSIAI